jgi:hypothetical protein
VHAWLESPIQGGDGNREFFIHASKAKIQAKTEAIAAVKTNAKTKAKTK